MLTVKNALIFAAGVAVGLYAAKLYARNQVNGTIATALDALGLGSLTPTVQGLVTPAVVN